MSAGADEIVGVAVLCEHGPIQWLYHVRRMGATGEGRLACDELPVMPEGGTPPAERLPAWFPENKPWRYVVEGDVLRVRPSVWIGNSFHNAGEWTVRFVRSIGSIRSDHYRQLAAVNPDLDILPKIERLLEFGE